MKKWLVVLLGMLVFSFGTSAQSYDPEVRDLFQFISGQTPDMFDVRFDAYMGFMLAGSRFTVEVTATRDSGTLEAVAQVTYDFPPIEPVVYARIEFLEPEELEGDIYLVVITDRIRDVFFWNEDLVSPINLDKQFPIFGDATVFEIIGYRLGEADYLFGLISVSDESLDGIAQPSTEEEMDFAGNEIIRLLDFEIRARPERSEVVLFPNATVVAYEFETVTNFGPNGRNTSINKRFWPYKIKLFDSSGDLLHTIEYDWRDFRRAPANDRLYSEKQTIINHVIPGNTTTLVVTDVEVGDFPDELFDPALLGQ